MVVIDASVGHKWFNKEESDVDKALKILEAHLVGQNSIVVPDIILYELANVWSTMTSLATEETIDNLKQFKKYNLKIISIDFVLLKKAVNLSKKYQVTVYDATYAVLAKEKKCDLITADKKFVAKINLSFVKLLEEYKI